jgi:hypothetical protein
VKSGMTLMLVLVILLAGCGSESGNNREGQQLNQVKASNAPTELTDSSASWVTNRMIKFEDRIYVGSEEKVESVDEKLGEIEHFLSEETLHEPNGSSNFYKEGTALYQIKGVPMELGIAVEAAPGQYVKAEPVEKMLEAAR